MALGFDLGQLSSSQAEHKKLSSGLLNPSISRDSIGRVGRVRYAWLVSTLYYKYMISLLQKEMPRNRYSDILVIRNDMYTLGNATIVITRVYCIVKPGDMYDGVNL